jgi:hypothetical protein
LRLENFLEIPLALDKRVMEIPSFEIREIMPGEHDCMSEKNPQSFHFHETAAAEKTFSSSLFDVGWKNFFFRIDLMILESGWRHFIEYFCAVVSEEGEEKEQ